MRVAIGFYHLPEDQAALREFLLSTGTVLARRNRGLPDPEEPEFGPLAEAFTSDGGVFLLCRPCDIESVTIDRYESQGRWWRAVNPESSPVLTYSYEPLDKPELYRSSLGASLDYVDLATHQRMQKPLDFKKWVKSVAAWVRAHCTATCTLYGFDYPCTPAVAAALKEGTIVLKN